MTQPSKLIPLAACITGRVYQLHCRNFRVGVYNGRKGFIGIREKFGSRYLFTEFHWEIGPPFGTVSETVDLEIDVPPEIQIAEDSAVIDTSTNRIVVFDPALKSPNNITNPPAGWYRYVDTNEVAPSVAEGFRSARVENAALFDFLDAIEVERSKLIYRILRGTFL
jgi:hypothetical protein